MLAFDTETGKERWFNDGKHHGAMIDGNTLYALVETDEDTDDYDSMIFELHRYPDMTQMESDIIYSQVLNIPRKEEFGIEQDSDHLYIKNYADLISIDKKSGDIAWSMSVGEALQSRSDILDSDVSYSLEAVTVTIKYIR
ncbi:hypothetical protein ACFSKI_12770 [Pseudogracilibacillus auburnensis]|uniref:Pyrroloquinoline-quinone binding quinoprotein n=1 Tax=Pseudogracilibacillus auburnensis TaxID=1494959 RepID=A0A2V3W9Y9_9BACI|nr:hypothetical protein [Pseudogracilibacillus auburnensis]MBO1005459.1 hypothetical protein [Pseudogracilibacillus auburnensis]PXW90356.1 hypothetical protein DFR56_101268 [Pseudogracilibacillus auburnensis]